MEIGELERPSRYRLRTACPTCITHAPVKPLRRPDGTPLTKPTRDFSPRSAFIRAKKLEAEYGKRLRGLAKIIDHIIRGFDVSTPEGIAAATAAVNRYAGTIGDWARAVARRMVTEVAARDERSWFRIAASMGRNMREEIQNAPTGQLMQARINEQVALIKSLPREAATRVQTLAIEARSTGTRPAELAAKILETGEVTRARANLIARTETSRTATEMTRARAEHVGSVGYIWRTSQDSDVRKSHKAMNGKFVRWDEPPQLDNLTGHAGALPNCRCVPEPVLPFDPAHEELTKGK
jgi:SPP1 gp7 family putative phage head morphogenesis protein